MPKIGSLICHCVVTIIDLILLVHLAAESSPLDCPALHKHKTKNAESQNHHGYHQLDYRETLIFEDCFHTFLNISFLCLSEDNCLKFKG